MLELREILQKMCLPCLKHQITKHRIYYRKKIYIYIKWSTDLKESKRYLLEFKHLMTKLKTLMIIFGSVLMQHIGLRIERTSQLEDDIKITQNAAKSEKKKRLIIAKRK